MGERVSDARVAESVDRGLADSCEVGASCGVVLSEAVVAVVSGTVEFAFSRQNKDATLVAAAIKAVTGVAIWDDVDPDANRFSLFITGLSNGWAVTDPIPPDIEPVVRRKTLQVNFKRLGDKFNQKSGEIQFIPPASWIYRAATVKIPPLGIANKEETGKKE
ncbi:hypothetical protein EBX93_10635 [bacterium]|nr:hypothetical protein [bacterium]